MTAKAYLIECITNLHAGSGKADQGVIDNLVQRDAVDESPAIFSSSLKGAFKSWFEYNENNSTIAIFGNDKSPDKGSHVFHDAQLIAIPVRCDKQPYLMATCPMLLNRLKEMSGVLNYRIDGLDEFLGQTPPFAVNIDVSGYDIDTLQKGSVTTSRKVANDKFIGKQFLVLTDEQFKRLVSDYNLPVIARNKIEKSDTERGNLFYEQVVPRKSQFIFFVNANISTDDKDLFEKQVNGNVVQIGANASIGYGVCKITKL